MLIRFGTRLILAALILMLTVPVLHAQQDTLMLDVGQTVTVTVDEASPLPDSAQTDAPAINGPTLTLEITEPQHVHIIATSADADPVWTLSRDGRELARIYDNPFSTQATRLTDAALDEMLLLPGTYQLQVGRVDSSAAPASIDVSVRPAESIFLGTGAVQIIDAGFESGTQYVHTLELQSGEVLSVAALAADAVTMDPQLELRGPRGDVVAFNDDHAVVELWLGDFDPKLNQIIIAESGTHTLIVRGYTDTMEGDFRLVFQRYGRLEEGSPTVEQQQGRVEARGRAQLTFEGRAGEFVQITAHSADGLLDAELALYAPGDIFITHNDDHNSATGGLYPYDPLINTLLLEKDGTYTAEVTSVVGKGDFTLMIYRIGTLNRDAAVSPIDPVTSTLEPYQAPEPVP